MPRGRWRTWRQGQGVLYPSWWRGVGVLWSCLMKRYKPRRFGCVRVEGRWEFVRVVLLIVVVGMDLSVSDSLYGLLLLLWMYGRRGR